MYARLWSFRKCTRPTARNVPLDTLTPDVLAAEAKRAGDGRLYVICKMGGRAAKAIDKFQQAGFDNLVNVTGGTDAWVQADLPVVRGRKVMSLERQVRIAAGFLVFAGALAAHRDRQCVPGRNSRVCGRWADVCRHHRHLRDGSADCPHAVESRLGLMARLR